MIRVASRRPIIAEMYLRMVADGGGRCHAAHYVQLAYKYGVPTGRIIALSALPAEEVIGYLEAGGL